MKKIVSIAILSAMSFPYAQAASFTLGLGVQAEQVEEFIATGSGGVLDRVVEETGALPVLILRVDSNPAPWRAHAELRYASGALDYAGQTNSGKKINSQTDYDDVLLELGGRMNFTNSAYLRAGLQAQWRQRDINGVGSAAGLQEDYQQNWLYLGLGIDCDQWTLIADGIFGLYGSQTVTFESKYDPAQLTMGDAWGLRLSAARDLGFVPGNVMLELQHRHVGLSARSNLSSNGIKTASTVYQPEMRTSSVGLFYRLSW